MSFLTTPVTHVDVPLVVLALFMPVLLAFLWVWSQRVGDALHARKVAAHLAAMRAREARIYAKWGGA